MFDFEYYQLSSKRKFHNIDEAIIHYVLVGEKIGLEASFFFSRFRYLCHNSDLHDMRMAPFTHFILYADRENRHY